MEGGEGAKYQAYTQATLYPDTALWVHKVQYRIIKKILRKQNTKINKKVTIIMKIKRW